MRQSRLKNYVIIYKGNDRFLYGRIYGDFRFPNGHMVLTTKVIDLNEDETIAITENQTEYKLENRLTYEEFVRRVKEEYVDTKYISFILSPLGVYVENKEKNA